MNATQDPYPVDARRCRTGDIDGIWVLGGIHAEELGLADGALPSMETLQAMTAKAGQRPNAALPLFSW